MKITCQLCNRQFNQISNSHMKKAHNTTLIQYKLSFPGCQIVSDEVADKIRSKVSGPKSPEHIANMSKSIREGYKNGRQANKGKLGKPDSDDTKELKRIAHLGLHHSEETKIKIGDGNRGKIMPRDAVERQKESLRLAIEANGHGFNLGMKHTDEFKAHMSEIALARTPEQIQVKVDMMNEARRGCITTPEQSENYRNGRIKYMNENPEKLKDTAGEIEIKTWLEQNNIEYRQQWTIKMFGHPYDFYLPKYNTLMEFDGTHHWSFVWFGITGKTQEEKDILLEQYLEKDAIENLEAGKKGFKVIRIRGYASCDSEEYGSLEQQLEIQGFKI